MADKLAEEIFCSERVSYLQRIKRSPSLLQQGQFTCYPLIDVDKWLAHKLVWLHETRDWLFATCEQGFLMQYLYRLESRKW